MIGGFVYRGFALGSAYRGRYFFADLLGRVWSLRFSVDRATGEASAQDLVEHTAELGGVGELRTISAFGIDADGELYIVNQSGGRILRITSTLDPERRQQRERNGKDRGR